MENLTYFLDACRKFGLRDTQLFVATDAYGANESVVTMGTDEETALALVKKDKDRKLRDVCGGLYVCVCLSCKGQGRCVSR